MLNSQFQILEKCNFYAVIALEKCKKPLNISFEKCNFVCLLCLYLSYLLYLCSGNAAKLLNSRPLMQASWHLLNRSIAPTNAS